MNMKGPITMRRHITILAALALAVSIAGCAKSAAPTGGGYGGTHARVGAVSPGQFHVVPGGYDPSVTGYPGAVGDIIQNAGSLSAWVRSGPNNTDWQAFPGSGGGTTYTAGAGIGIDAGTIANTAPFAGDVTVNAGDSIGTAVPELHLVASLTTTTHGSVTSDWTHTLLNGGAATTSMHETPTQTQMPAGTATVPGASFIGATGYGMAPLTGTSQLSFAVAGSQMMSLSNGSSGQAVNLAALGSFMISTAVDAGMKRNNSADIQLVTGHDVTLGADGALSTSATSGHTEIPTCAGAPTGTVSPRSGKGAIIIDSTDSKLCWSTGGGTWKCVTGT